VELEKHDLKAPTSKSQFFHFSREKEFGLISIFGVPPFGFQHRSNMPRHTSDQVDAHLSRDLVPLGFHAFRSSEMSLMDNHACPTAASSESADVRLDSGRVMAEAARDHRISCWRAVLRYFCHGASAPEHDLAHFHLTVLDRFG
jgi:hypothetical protein